MSSKESEAPNPTPDKTDRQSQPQQPQEPKSTPEDTDQEESVEHIPAVAEDASSAPEPPEIRRNASEEVLTVAGRDPEVKSYMERSNALGDLGLSLPEADVVIDSMSLIHLSASIRTGEQAHLPSPMFAEQ